MHNLKTNFIIFMMVAAAVLPATAIKKVHTIGDSTMANYDENATVTRGWAQYLQQFLTGLTVNNRGKAGASSKSFYEEPAYWKSVKTQMQPGDYVFIQFSHNDEKSNGMDGDSVKAYYTKVGDADKAAATDYRGTTPWGTYKTYLRKYIDETRAAGCTPVLVAPICRMYFSGNTIRRSGLHDLGDNFNKLTADGILTGQRIAADNDSMDYVAQMRSVAEEKGVAFLDMTEATRKLYLSYGDTKCHELLSDGNGSTHLNTMGATLIARLCAQLMRDSSILADHVVLNSNMNVTPDQSDMGMGYKGQSLIKTFSVSGFSLQPQSGYITVEASKGLRLSHGNMDWKDTLQIAYGEGTCISSFNAQYTLLQEGEFSGEITVKQAGQTVTIPVSAKALSLEGGQDVTAYWRLESDDSYTLSGPATVLPESWSGMYVQRYSSPNAKTVWPEWTGYDAKRKTQRNLIVGDKWPEGEIDEVSTRYIEFGITPAVGTKLNIDSIGMFICGCGGNGMRCHINYSTEPDFANQHTIFSPTQMPANNMLEVAAKTVIELQPSDTLRVRVYPWYNNKATGKTVCLSDVTIHGKAIDASTAITQTTVKGQAILPSQYYNLQGMAVSNPQKGVYIVNRRKIVKK